MTTKSNGKPLTESEKQTQPMKGEVDPKNLFTKLTVAATRALILSGIDKAK